MDVSPTSTPVAPALSDTSGRWRVAVGAILIQICLGAIYAWSVFTPGREDAPTP